MADIYLDRNETGAFVVTVCRGISEPKKRTFADRAEAEAFAESKLGKRTGCICSTLDMTPDQLAAHREREARAMAMAAKLAQWTAENAGNG